jgi:hypothetical protein
VAVDHSLGEYLRLWRWAQGVEKVTKNALTAVPVFLLCWFIGIIGAPIIQSYFNKVSPTP